MAASLRIGRVVGRLIAAATVIAAGALAIPAGASASPTTLCPSSGSVGGIAQSSVNVPGPLDGSCGANSAVSISIAASTDYGKLTFSSISAGFPSTTLGNLLGLSASVTYTNVGGLDQPFYELAFVDPSASLGQASSGDQILLIEFQPSTLSGSALALDPSATLFNTYDNTTGNYLEGGQSHTNTLSGWLAADPSLSSDTLQEVRIAIGLTGSDTGPESLTVNTASITVAEPGSVALLGVGLVGLQIGRRRVNVGLR